MYSHVLANDLLRLSQPPLLVKPRPGELHCHYHKKPGSELTAYTPVLPVFVHCAEGRCLYNAMVYGRFTPLTFRTLDVSPLTGRFATCTFRPQDVSPQDVCRVLSLSDRRYSLNPLSQTRID